MAYNRPGQHIDTLITRDVFKVSPQVRFRYKFSKTSQLDIRYRGSSSEPSMTDLLAVVDDADPLNISMGNPGLKPSWSNTLRVSYHGYNPERQQGLMGGVNFSQTSNAISNRMVYDRNHRCALHASGKHQWQLEWSRYVHVQYRSRTRKSCLTSTPLRRSISTIPWVTSAE